MSEDIGGRLAPGYDECPDCGDRAHWKLPCECGCPSGIERKRQRDEGVVGAKGDSARNTNPGFY